MGSRILVVDDDEAVSRMLQTMLAIDGHRVDVTQDGVQALQCLRREAYALVVTDLRMAGMDGLTLIRAIGVEVPGLPVILLTGCADDKVRAEALAAGARDVVGKPFDFLRLRDAVRRGLGEPLAS